MLPDYLLMRSLLFVALYFTFYYRHSVVVHPGRSFKVPFSRAEYIGKAHAGEPEVVVQTILGQTMTWIIGDRSLQTY